MELLLDTLWKEACALGREDEREYDDIVLGCSVLHELHVLVLFLCAAQSDTCRPDQRLGWWSALGYQCEISNTEYSVRRFTVTCGHCGT